MCSDFANILVSIMFFFFSSLRPTENYRQVYENMSSKVLHLEFSVKMACFPGTRVVETNQGPVQIIVGQRRLRSALVNTAHWGIRTTAARRQGAPLPLGPPLLRGPFAVLPMSHQSRVTTWFLGSFLPFEGKGIQSDSHH